MFLGQNILDPQHRVAIKVLNKERLAKEADITLEEILEEFNILKQLDHPNIVKYYETYDDPRHLYLVMEYCPNGDLIEHITAKVYN